MKLAILAILAALALAAGTAAAVKLRRDARAWSSDLTIEDANRHSREQLHIYRADGRL